MKTEIDKDTYEWMETLAPTDIWEKFAKEHYPIAYEKYHKDRRLSRVLDIFGMLGAIYLRWSQISDKTEKIFVDGKHKWIKLPKFIDTPIGIYELKELPTEASFIEDTIELHRLQGYEFESKVGYSEKLDCFMVGI